jgi:hypothetical protein
MLILVKISIPLMKTILKLVLLDHRQKLVDKIHKDTKFEFF